MIAQKVDMPYLMKTFRAPMDEAALLKNVPMEMEYIVRKLMASTGRPYRLKYRGKRRTGWFTTNDKTVYYRSRATAAATCLKQDAERFSVYFA